MKVTAVILSKELVTRQVPGCEVLVHVSTIASPRDLLKARFDAIKGVNTKYFFFLDDDDELPEDFDNVLAECLTKIGDGLVFTDEMINDKLLKHKGYTRDEHSKNPMLVHHLVLCNTANAKEVIKRLPVGDYAPEVLLYWALAKFGAVHVPRVGYIWKRKPTGMSHWPSTVISQMRALLYNKDQ